MGLLVPHFGDIDELLRFIEARSIYSFLYPMAVMAAHTGARRSELVRSRVGDLDFQAGTVLIREKKRVNGRRTIWRVSVYAKLRAVIEDWLRRKRSSAYTFPAEFKCHRERKERPDADAVGAEEARHHLEATLLGSKSEKTRGWHIFRRSFISNCAAKGIDQRVIDRWSGHQTDEVRQRTGSPISPGVGRSPNCQYSVPYCVTTSIRPATWTCWCRSIRPRHGVCGI